MQDDIQKDWDSYEIGEKEIRSVFDAVFYVYDKESVGYLNGEQFGNLMNAFANDCQPPVSITETELASFMDILDKDKNGIVEQNEFVSVSFFMDTGVVVLALPAMALLPKARREEPIAFGIIAFVVGKAQD